VICPNDHVEMQQVRVESHYGLPVILEQCKSCGGIWFDQFELYSIKSAQAEKIELLDSEILSCPAQVASSNLVCPRDQNTLIQFSDINFPKEIIVERCPQCNGFWLNRGEFTRYQKIRQGLQRSKETSPEQEQRFKEDIRKILSENREGGYSDVLLKLGRFFSTEVYPLSQRPLEPETMAPGGQRAFDTIMNILTLILRVFVFKG
jgi:Zn-finger nucleic acid-binding protein